MDAEIERGEAEARRAVGRPRRQRDLAVDHQGLPQPAGLAAAQQARQHLQGIGVLALALVVGRREVVARPARLGDARVGAHDPLRQVGGALARPAPRIDLARGDRPVVLLGELAHLVGRGVAGHDQDRVVGRVPLGIERREIVDVELLHVVDIARDRHAVGLVAAVELLLHRLAEQRGRRVVDAHAALLEHDLALGDQLLLGDAQVGHAVGLHAHDHLQPVGRDGLVVARGVEARIGVVAPAVLARRCARTRSGPTVPVPLNIMCSRKWAMPVLP